MDTEPLAFPALTTMLKAAGEATRLRILALIAEAELTVSDLTEILRQSQPRLSRHLRLLAEAGLVERFREGSWAFFRLRERGSAADIARAMITRLDAKIRSSPATASGSPRCAPRAPPRRRIISAGTRPSGTASANFMSPTPPSKRRSAARSPTSRSDRCSISAPAPAGCWSCSR